MHDAVTALGVRLGREPAALQELQSTQLGGLLHVMRKPFKVTYYSGDQANSGLDAVLDRSNELEYHVQGRMSVQYGHPYTVFRVDAS